VPITFIFVVTQARGRVSGVGVDVARFDHHLGLSVAAVLLPRPSLILVLVLVLVIAPRSILAIVAQLLLVAVLVLQLLRVVSE
jgi:hypothetical protein